MKEQSAGGLIFNGNKIALVQNKNMKWSFPKGHIDQGETALEAAYREIEEETGLSKLDIVFVRELDFYTRPTHKGNEKDIHMFIFASTKEKLKPKDPENPDAKWVTEKEASELLFYEDDKLFLKNNLKQVKKNKLKC